MFYFNYFAAQTFRLVSISMVYFPLVSTSENVQLPPQNQLSSPDQRYGTRPSDLFTSATRTRCAIRWQVLHRCAHHANLLPPDLPRANLQGMQCSLLSQRSSSCRSRFSPVLAMPPGV